MTIIRLARFDLQRDAVSRFAAGQADLSRPFISLGKNPLSMMRQEQVALKRMESFTVDVPVHARMRSSDEALVHVLESLASEIGGVRALVVGDRSGLPIVSTFRGPASMTTTAMATLALSAATKVTSSLNLPEPEDILIEAGGWRVLVQLLGNGLTLTCVLPADENLGLVKLAMQARGREIREIIDDIV
ncbi:MAG: hypothetical protein E6K15_05570 [Methanobacteriota archaeon]|nr:MAG: hypothetical protein E6K15_05570 [Euryarchaeota archaeon]